MKKLLYAFLKQRFSWLDLIVISVITALRTETHSWWPFLLAIPVACVDVFLVEKLEP